MPKPIIHPSFEEIRVWAILLTGNQPTNNVTSLADIMQLYNHKKMNLTLFCRWRYPQRRSSTQISAEQQRQWIWEMPGIIMIREEDWQGTRGHGGLGGSEIPSGIKPNQIQLENVCAPHMCFFKRYSGKLIMKVVQKKRVQWTACKDICIKGHVMAITEWPYITGVIHSLCLPSFCLHHIVFVLGVSRKVPPQHTFALLLKNK